MLRVVNTQKQSVWRNFKNFVKGYVREQTPSSGYTFYQDDTMVGEMTIFLAGNAEVKLGGDILLLKMYRAGLFTSDWGVERNGRSLATARVSPRAWTSCRINYTNRGLAHELTMRFNVWRLRGREIRVFEAGSIVGTVERQGNGMMIDLPEEVSLPVQIFIFKIARRLFDVGPH